MSLNSFSTFKHTLTQADSLTLCTMYHTSLIQAAVVLLKDWNCCLVTSQIWTRSCFFFFHPKEAAQPQFYVWIPFLLFMFPLCFFASVHLICELFGFLSFFFIAPQMELSFYLEITKTTFKKRLSEPVQQSGAFWKSYARTRAHLSEEGSIKCSKLLWSKISEQSCWTEVAVYLSWPWQTPARFTIQ